MVDVLQSLRASLATAPPAKRFELLDAVAATCLLMARADGQVQAEELARIRATLSQLDDAREVSRIEARLNSVWKELAAQGVDAMLAEIVKQLPDTMARSLALQCAAGVAFADGHYDFEEEVLIGRIGAAFGLGEEETRRLVVMSADGS